MLFCCSEGEAAHLGVFLFETLSLLEKWKVSKEVYEKECEGVRGFSTSFQDPTGKRASFADFIKVSYKWQYTIAKVQRGSFYIQL